MSIIIKNVNKIFGDTKILDDINFEFESNKTNLVIGKSGSGKSVLTKCIVGLYDIDSGEINFDGNSINNVSRKQKQEIQANIGMLFQGGALFDYYNVEKNVMFPLDMFRDKMTESEKKKRVDFCLEVVGLSGKNHLFPSELSGGMMKRVGIARAIVLEPKYLFCDEPNSGLDPQTSLLIDDLIMNVTKSLKITTVVVTHDMNSVMEIGENILFINKGKLEWTGNNKTILNSTNKNIEDFVFASDYQKKLKDLIRNN